MTDPKRWIESEDASLELESRVLREELRRSPPAGLEDASWAALAANIAAQAAATSATATSGSSGGSALASGTSVGGAGGAASGVLTALKAAAVGAGIGAVMLSGAELLRPAATTEAPSVAATIASVSVSASAKRAVSTLPSAERPVSSPPPASTEPPREAAAVSATDARERNRLSPTAASREVPALEPSVPPPAFGAAASASFPDSGSSVAEPSSVAEVALAASAQRDELKQEALELASAKHLLRAGRASEAYSALVRSAQRFPVGALSEERELLLVETLSALGQSQVARDRAQRFLNTHPHSAITVRMRRFVDRK